MKCCGKLMTFKVGPTKIGKFKRSKNKKIIEEIQCFK
jgi:hypothetical protein